MPRTCVSIIVDGDSKTALFCIFYLRYFTCVFNCVSTCVVIESTLHAFIYLRFFAVFTCLLNVLNILHLCFFTYVRAYVLTSAATFVALLALFFNTYL